MSVFFIGKIIPPEGAEIDKFPPSIYTNHTWFTNITNTLVAQGEWNPDYRNGYVKMPFDNETDLENWVRSNALTDTGLINDIKEWNRSYGITHVNEIHHADGTVTATSLSLIPLE